VEFAELIPVTGAWRPGDPPGRRRFAELYATRPHVLEAGGRLTDVTIAYETWGELNAARDNAVLVMHALTGDSHARGEIEPGHVQEGWWEQLIGAGAAIDTNRYFVVCPNVLGGCQGSTGPSSFAADGRPYGSRFPVLTIRDQVVAEAALADAIGVDCWAAVVGGSMGGMRVLEWIVGFPERVRSAAILAVGARATAEQIALCSMATTTTRVPVKVRTKGWRWRVHSAR
jgi:homoserine O-acetyltransferase